MLFTVDFESVLFTLSHGTMAATLAFGFVTSLAGSPGIPNQQTTLWFGTLGRVPREVSFPLSRWWGVVWQHGAATLPRTVCLCIVGQGIHRHSANGQHLWSATELNGRDPQHQASYAPSTSGEQRSLIRNILVNMNTQLSYVIKSGLISLDYIWMNDRKEIHWISGKRYRRLILVKQFRRCWNPHPGTHSNVINPKPRTEATLSSSIWKIHETFESNYIWKSFSEQCTNNVPVAIEIKWKFHFAPIPVLLKWLLWILAHDTTAMYIWCTAMELHWNQISIEIKLQCRDSPTVLCLCAIFPILL